MNKYFRVPLEAARMLAEESIGPELLAGYVVMNRWAIPPGYNTTAAGAKAIRKATGLSEYRAKRVLKDLLALRAGEKGELCYLAPTGKRIKNADVYRIGKWDGDIAYLPDLLTQGSPAPLSRLVRAEAEPEAKRDALLMLLHVHANVDYSEYFGVAPDAFTYINWTGEGAVDVGGLDFELGHAGNVGGLNFWLMGEDAEGQRYVHPDTPSSIYLRDADKRFRPAHDLLLQIGMLSRVAIVETMGTTYLLWAFSPAYREALSRIGMQAGLADDIYRAADNAGLDPDNSLIAEATSGALGESGTRVFFIVTTSNRMPNVKTIYAPMFHAPSPSNLDGIQQAVERIDLWRKRLGRNKTRSRDAA